MNQMLQDAIAATRQGDKKEAQRLLANNLKENPNDVQSWYLLSMLVDSREKQAAYLSKALALDPNHTKAQARMGQLTKESGAAKPLISDTPFDFEAQETGETLPSWLADETGYVAPEKDSTFGELEAISLEVQDVPEWVVENVDETWTAPSKDTSHAQPRKTATKQVTPPKQAITPTAKKPAPAKKPTKKQDTRNINIALGVLVFFAIIVSLILISMLIN